MAVVVPLAAVDTGHQHPDFGVEATRCALVSSNDSIWVLVIFIAYPM